MKEELKLYIKNNLVKEKVTLSKAFNKKATYVCEECVSDRDFSNATLGAGGFKDIDLKSYLQEKDKYNDFQTTLFKLIDDRKLLDSEVYNKVHIDRRLFSKIRNDKDYHPSKETVLLLGLSLELSEEEIEKLLDSASYSLPKNNHYDLIIRFCFMKGIYKISDVNDLLDEYNCKLFNY